ncbi:MAG: F0F1 ATP synthase subunit delta [Chromatiales bacterium]|jgi:F-type H+-transporting ATPase subunit b
MELNWTTLILEMVNFLVLVWILKRFLYRPVLQVIEQRRLNIQSRLDEAQSQQQQAAELRRQYEHRLADWQQEKAVAREALQQEMEGQRKQALQALDADLARAREKARVVEQRRLQEQTEHLEREALELGGRFACRLLQDLAGPELEARILGLLGRELVQLPDSRRQALQRTIHENGRQLRVESAHPLNDRQRQDLEQNVRQLLGGEVNCNFQTQPALIAGLRLSLGDWSLEANLREELRAFVDTARELD